MTTPVDLVGIIERDREWGEATPSPDAVVWTRDQLAEAYLLAGMDRRALLGLLRETREALGTQHGIAWGHGYGGITPSLLPDVCANCRLLVSLAALAEP